jgi:hypothetical protein
MTLVIFTEEPSMKEALLNFLPKLDINMGKVVIIAHQGVDDLEKSLPKKLRAYTDPNARFLILRDNDRGDCRARKAKLEAIVLAAGRSMQTRVRIVCQELEAWFIGDCAALEASGQLKKPLPGRLRRCDPDVQPHPALELKKLNPGYGKIGGAQAIAFFLEPDRNRSQSFNQTVSAIRFLLAA